MGTFAPDKWQVAWNPRRGTYGLKRNGEAREPGAVKMLPMPSDGEYHDFCCTSGCCNFDIEWAALSQEQLMDELIRGFFFLVLSEGIDPDAVHSEFSKIKGYLSYAGRVGLGQGHCVFFQGGNLNPYNP